MAERRSKTQRRPLLWLLAIGIPLVGIAVAGQIIGWDVIAGGVVGIIVLIAAIVWLLKNNRRRKLIKKYQDETLVDALLEQRFWEGQTADQLLDALGDPHDVDQKVLKTKKKEIWKYDHRGHNRYDLRITLDDDVVVGWDQKD